MLAPDVVKACNADCAGTALSGRATAVVGHTTGCEVTHGTPGLEDGGGIWACPEATVRHPGG